MVAFVPHVIFKDLEVIKREGKEEMHVSREEKVQRFKEHKEAEMKIKFVKEKISRLNEDEDDLSSDIDELLREQVRWSDILSFLVSC